MALQPTGEIVVIGSGMTGLCLGALLASAGYPVRILEAHPSAIGGHARTLTIAGMEFCAGPRYVWGFGKNQVGQRVLETLNLEKEIPFIPMDPDAFERFAVGGNSPVAIPMGLERYATLLMELFPQETAGLQRFFAVIQEMYEVSTLVSDQCLYLQSPNRMRLGVMLGENLHLVTKLNAFRFTGWTLKDLYDHCHLSQPVRRLLYGHSGVFAESESQLSMLIYASATGYYHQGAYLPSPGFGRLVTALSQAIQKNGEVLCGKRVTRLLTDGNKINRVDCSDGSTFTCQAVISTLSPRLTARLLPGALERRYTYRNSNTVNCFFMGVTGQPQLVKDLKLKNLWWQEGSQEVEYEHPDATRPPQVIYLGSQSTQRQPDQTGEAGGMLLDVTAFTAGNFEQARAAYHQGMEAYAAYKHRVTERLVETIEHYLFPNFHTLIQFIEIYTPLDIFHELGAENGSTYGRRMDVRSFLQGPPPQLPFTNLHMASATVGLEGITNAFQSAVYWLYKLTGIKV